MYCQLDARSGTPLPRQSVRRLLSCRLFVGCDSGLGHLAGCLGVPGLIVSTDDFETTWSFFREYASLSVVPLAAADLLLP